MKRIFTILISVLITATVWSQAPQKMSYQAVVRDAIGDGLYNTLQHSRGILIDLTPPVPGSMLFWLNAQVHPDIEYVSIVRSSGYNIAGDIAVPPFSQDMNQLPVLAGKSRTIIVLQGHELTPNDGKLLAELL